MISIDFTFPGPARYGSGRFPFSGNFATIGGVKISAVLITHNEEKNIAAALKSVQWADEVLVVDSESTDRTREIAADLGAKVTTRKWPGFAAQKQFAVDAAENDWILSLDADERVSPELEQEIIALKGEPAANGFRIPRLSFYIGRPIRHGGWYPDRQLRLFDRTKGRWKEVRIHESFQLDDPAKVVNLNSDILHYTVESAAYHHRLIGERYAPLAAEQMAEEGRTASPLRIALAGPTAFIRTFILKLGFLDGLPGFAIAAFAAHHAFLKNLLLWEMREGKEQPTAEEPLQPS